MWNQSTKAIFIVASKCSDREAMIPFPLEALQVGSVVAAAGAGETIAGVQSGNQRKQYR